MDSDVVGNQQIFPRSSTRALRKYFLQETFCSHGRLCVGCNDSCGYCRILSYGKQPRKLTVEPVAPCVQFLQSMFLSKNYGSLPIVSIAVPSVTIVVCYIKIYQTIRQHNAASAPSSQGGHSSYGVEEAKITRMLTVVVVGFYLCWLPPLINITLLSLALLGETAMNYGNFSFFVPLFASSVINPMVYGTMSQSFRKEFLKILRRQP